MNDPREFFGPFGVLDFLSWDHDWNHHHYGGDNVERAAVLMREAGVAFVRMDFLWSDIEPERGRFDFDKYDRILSVLERHGIRLLGLLHYNAAWEPEWNTPPDTELFSAFARAVVGRYRKQVKYWEIWNEPNEETYWKPQDGLSAYVSLLKKVTTVIKAEDPTSVVLLGGLSTRPELASLEQIYEKGGHGYFDIVNIHPFVHPALPDPLKKLLEIYEHAFASMRRHGDEKKPIWFTEIGCPGMPDGVGLPNWWLGSNSSEAEQARWLEMIYGEPLKWKGVQKVFWAFFRDTPDHFKDGVDRFGIVQKDFSKKPAFEIYKKLSAEWRSRQR